MDVGTSGDVATVLWPPGSMLGVREEIQQLADGALPEESLGQGPVDLDGVAVAAAVFRLVHVSGFHEVCDDAVRGALGDAECARDFP